MDKTTISLRGILTPIVTSFDERGDVAHDKIACNLEKWNKTGLRGYIVLGSNGEWVFLNEQERLDVLRTARQAIPKDKLMIAGTAAESVRHTLVMTERAATVGADAAIIVNPSYYRSHMTQPVLSKYYCSVADEAPIPIVIYNLPSATGIDLSAELLGELSQHPNIVAVKDTGGNLAKMAETIRQAAPAFQVLAGSADFFYPSLAVGVSGGVLALANIAPQESIAMLDLFQTRRLTQGRALHLRMLPVNLAITSRFGVSGLKAALDMLGYYGGPPRLPMLPLGPAQLLELRDILTSAALLQPVGASEAI